MHRQVLNFLTDFIELKAQVVLLDNEIKCSSDFTGIQTTVKIVSNLQQIRIQFLILILENQTEFDLLKIIDKLIALNINFVMSIC